MNYKNFNDIQLSRLGLGNMRLPSTNPNDPQAPIDWPWAHKLMKLAFDSGINYFDTAYVYQKGESERCVGEGIKQFNREDIYIATKYNVGANPDYKAVFAEQLERLQTDYIDFYLIHCLMDNNLETYLNDGSIDYFLKMKEEGKIRYLGFSSHASVETLEKFASHHQWDFAQLQINYFDWVFSSTSEEYKVLEDKNIPIMVMEPVRGGRLASLPEDVEAMLKEAHPEWSIPSWALRFVKSLPQVQVVLSGMSTLDQVTDNVNTFSDDYEFTEADREVLFEAARLFKKSVSVPCTGCRYCTDDCPMKINIPEYLKAYNVMKVDGANSAKSMMNKIESEGTPSDCIGCGACMGHCPQGIDIPSVMAELKEL